MFDHGTARLEQVKARVGNRNNVVAVEKLKEIQTDAVLIWRAIEHFLHPGGVCELSANMLREDGIRLLLVTNIFTLRLFSTCWRNAMHSETSSVMTIITR